MPQSIVIKLKEKKRIFNANNTKFIAMGLGFIGLSIYLICTFHKYKKHLSNSSKNS